MNVGKKIISCLLSLTVTISMICGLFAVEAGAADYSSARVLEPNKSVSLSNSGAGSKEAYLKLVLPDSGKVRFYAASSETSSKTTYEYLSSKGKSMLSGKFTELTDKARTFGKKGTYYLKFTLAEGQSIKGLYYTFTAQSGKKVSKSIDCEEGRSYDLGAYVKGFKGNIKWLSSASSVAKINSKGVLTALAEGTADIRAYSSKGDYAAIKVTVKAASGSSGVEWLTGYDLSNSNKEQLVNAFAGFHFWTEEKYFKEGEIDEVKALNWIYNTNGKIIDPTSDTGLFKDLDTSEEMIPVKAELVDDRIYHLFGVNATHKVKSDRYWWNYSDGNYYFMNGAAGVYNYTEYGSHEKLSDGRFLVDMKYYIWDGTGANGILNFDVTDVYALVSIHEAGGKKYVRLHAVTKTRADALNSY